MSDYAEVVNGKLYLVGGGWKTYSSSNFPGAVRLGLVLGFSVQRSEVGQANEVRVTLQKVGDKDPVAAITFNLGTNVNPTRPQDIEGVIPAAFNLTLPIPEPGRYEFTARVGSHGTIRRAPFVAELVAPS